MHEFSNTCWIISGNSAWGTFVYILVTSNEHVWMFSLISICWTSINISVFLYWTNLGAVLFLWAILWSVLWGYMLVSCTILWWAESDEFPFLVLCMKFLLLFTSDRFFGIAHLGYVSFLWMCYYYRSFQLSDCIFVLV